MRGVPRRWGRDSAAAVAPAPQGRNVSSRGRAPGERHLPLTPSPLLVRAGRGAGGGVRGYLPVGFHPRLLTVLPSGEPQNGTVKPLAASLVKPVAYLEAC